MAKINVVGVVRFRHKTWVFHKKYTKILFISVADSVEDYYTQRMDVSSPSPPLLSMMACIVSRPATGVQIQLKDQDSF